MRLKINATCKNYSEIKISKNSIRLRLRVHSGIWTFKSDNMVVNMNAEDH